MCEHHVHMQAPQRLQWCLRITKLKAREQTMHPAATESGTHSCLSRICRATRGKQERERSIVCRESPASATHHFHLDDFVYSRPASAFEAEAQGGGTRHSYKTSNRTKNRCLTSFEYNVRPIQGSFYNDLNPRKDGGSLDKPTPRQVWILSL